MEYENCICPHCQQSLEYPITIASQVMECPVCREPLTLPPRRKTEGFLESLSRKFKKARNERVQKGELKKLLLEAVQDGILTDAEIEQVRNQMEEAGLSHADIAGWRSELFTQAMTAVDKRGPTSEGIQSLLAIQTFLRIHDSEIPVELERVRRWQTIASIRDGSLPPIQRPVNIVLGKTEQVFWVQSGTLYEERVVSKRYEGGSRGISVRIMKGVSLRAGSHRGRMVSESATIAVSKGCLLITNRRLIFAGNTKSFDTKFDKLLDVTTHLDGIVFSELNKQKQRRIGFDSPDGDIVAEIVSYAVSSFGT